MAQVEKQGNSNIGMKGNSIDEAAKSVPEVDSSGFFGALEDQVNGSIQDKNTEATRQVKSDPNMATRNPRPDGSNNVPQRPNNGGWQKRYQDSSREAVKLKRELNRLKPFVPVLDAMKKDSGLVDHVRDYLVSGGKPNSTIQEKLNLPENFVFDQQEAMTDPDSNSAKVMNAHVDSLVKKRVGDVVSREKANARSVNQAMRKRNEALAFKKRKGMSDEEFNRFVNQAKTHTLTMDDIHYLLNKKKAATNVSNATRQDMLNQMKNVRNMPQTASGANSQAKPENPDNTIFDGILGLDSGVDNLFGD